MLSGRAQRRVFSVLLSLAVSIPCASAVEYKFGFVNVAKVLDMAPQAEEARGRIEREFAPKDRELLNQQQELRNLEDTLIRDRDTLGEEERINLERDIRTQKRDLKRAQDEFQEDLNLRRSQELSELQRKVVDVIQGLAKAESYDLIVSDGVIFAGDRVDITGEIIARLKAEFEKSQGQDEAQPQDNN